MEQTNQNQQGQQPQFRCSKDCRLCPQHQRIYCSSQHALSNMLVLDKIMETLTGMQGQVEAMQGTIQEMAAKVDAIQSSEAAVFDPDGQGEPFPKEFAVDQTEAGAAK